MSADMEWDVFDCVTKASNVFTWAKDRLPTAKATPKLKQKKKLKKT